MSTMKRTAFVAAAVVLATRCSARTFTVVNACPFTIWPALFTDPNVGKNLPDQPTGWEAPAFSSVSFTVPDDWKAGRIWGRRNCDFNVTPGGPLACATGGCNGGLLCDPVTGTGVPPASLAEWTLQGDGNRDFYDVSLVDGYNLPMRISNNRGCPVADCAVDLGPSCPAELRGPIDDTGLALGCRGSCLANLDGHPENSPNCCSGSFATPDMCPPTGVAFYSYFKDNCPNSYAYAYDEGSNTALWTCDSGLLADYTLTFCPPADVNAPLPANITPMNVSTSPPSPISIQDSGNPSSTASEEPLSTLSTAETFSNGVYLWAADWRLHVLALSALWVLLR